MVYNNFSYTVFGVAQFGIRAGLGFTGGNFSTDGLYVVGDRGETGHCEECDDALVKPSYIPAEKFPNWPHLSHQEARELIAYPATSQGASDGWIYTDPQDL